MDTKKLFSAIDNLRQIPSALERVNAMLIKLSTSVPMKADKLGMKKEKKKTQKGAKHKQGRVFLGRQILPVTPAAYRRMHMGVKK